MKLEQTHEPIEQPKRTLKSFSLDKKVCVVTGGARGLGYVMLQSFIESGATEVAIIDVNIGMAVEELLKWSKDTFPSETKLSVIGIPCDISEHEQVHSAFEQIVEKFGRIDVLVCSAGFCENYKAEDYPVEKWKKMMGVNLDGTWYCAQEAGRDMLRRKAGGSILLVSSMSASVINIPQVQSAYNVSKAGVKHMASSLAVEWAKAGIRVNSLSPGYMLTALTQAIIDKNPELNATWTGLTPMGRMGEPEDLKGAVVYLASDASKFVTGIDLKVDGGYTLV
ncbi:NAD(P)-binding protein [Atractiella rhizophila]|nr:NAD(P)-binding protein [Atractiella rhizophila]